MISITDLWKSFGSSTVLRGASLNVPAGQVSVLLGGSGSGKSTLLRMINGLETFDRGTVQVAGIELPGTVGKDRDVALLQIRRKVGMVFQKFHLFPHLTVLQNVIEAPVQVLKMPVPEAIALAKQLLDKVGMGFKPTPCLDRFPVASNSEWPSPEHWPCRPQPFCLMNPPAHWTPKVPQKSLP
jgi:polar amino acid transport system ATP-binding protein